MTLNAPIMIVILAMYRVESIPRVAEASEILTTVSEASAFGYPGMCTGAGGTMRMLAGFVRLAGIVREMF
jgi:hypothetical protein